MCRLFFLLLTLTYLTSALNPEKPNEGKIVGGTPANIRNFPFQVSLQQDFRWHTCGASIITPNLILCAAHCIDWSKVPTYQIRAGSANRYAGGVTVPVKSVKVHPQYNPQTNDNDIAIIELTRYLVFSTTIQAIKLAPKGFTVPEGAKFVVSGWGTMRSGAPTSPNGLRAAIVPFVNQTTCSKAYTLTPRMICAGKVGKDSCQGDSG